MKLKAAIVFIFIVFFLVSIFVGLPYFFTKLKSIDFSSINLPFIKKFPSADYQRVGGGLPAIQPTGPAIRAGESIYKGKVKISGVSRSNLQQINLSANFSESGAINITGWRIRSAQRRIEIVIGKGFALPQFNSFSSDIWLKRGDFARITAAASPLLSNFQVNGCFGWLSNIYNLGAFNYCPSIRLGDLSDSGLDGACKDLILSSGSCRAPSDNVLNSYSPSCKLWVEKNLNYNSCVAKHMNDSGFYKGWQIYTGNSNLLFDDRHDKIEFLDQVGLMVDSYEY
ncbi:hypothetical protein HZB06_03030 [Candidatus Wolfebacteria bacterium]|nr:hypothetical protein [Candidatus Wolfebacteria bacterium]